MALVGEHPLSLVKLDEASVQVEKFVQLNRCKAYILLDTSSETNYTSN